jgi:DNA-binding MarR family transcriptional regulator
MKINSYTQQSPIFLAYNFHNSIQSFYARSLKEHDVNFVQALILLTLYFEGKSKITPMSLVKNLSISKSSISQALSSLEQAGWLKRKMDEEDARSLSLVLTADGKKHANKLIPIFHGIERAIEGKLGKEKIKELCGSLNVISSILLES